MKKRERLKYLFYGLAACVMLLLPGERALAERRPTDYSHYEIIYSPDGEAWTMYQRVNASKYFGYNNRGPLDYCFQGDEIPYFWYGPEESFGTGIASTLRETAEGEHYYKYDREGMMPVGQWRVAWSHAMCIHGTEVGEIGGTWHGIRVNARSCGLGYFSGWFAYCADCGEPIQSNIYMSKEAARSITQIPLKKDYYYLCSPIDTSNKWGHFEQGVTLEHECKAISFNKYKVVYERNGFDHEIKGYMADSYHMYNNAELFEGNQVTPVKHLSRNSYVRTGYRFVGWNTEPDGSGAFFGDEAEIFNLTAENNGSVTLYAQWEKVESSLAFDANGGTYTGENPVRKSYKTVYNLVSTYESVVPPAGCTVSFDTSGGSVLPPISGTMSFVRWDLKEPLNGQFRGTSYLFTGAMDTVDTAVAVYEADPILLPKPEASNLTFGGWYADRELTEPVGDAGDEYTPREDVTLYARWVDLKLYSTDNYTDNEGKGAVDLRWTQPDREEKSYKLYQSGDDGRSYVQISEVSASAGTEELLDRSFVFEKGGSAPREQTVIIPSSGIYEVTAQGAQGGGFGSYKGGLGGSMSGRFYLTRGEKLTVLIGGQDGTNGGGAGTAYGNGGGMTMISSDKKEKGVLLAAGGGGGAGAEGDGQSGGVSIKPAPEDGPGEAGMSGGGGGYPGGAAGEYIVHNHSAECFTLDSTALYSGFYDSHGDDYGDPQVWSGFADPEDDEEHDFIQLRHTVTNFENYDVLYAEYTNGSAFAESVRQGKSYVKLSDQNGRELASVCPGELTGGAIFNNGRSIEDLVLDTLASCCFYEDNWEAYGELVSSYTFGALNINMQFSYFPTEGEYDEEGEPDFHSKGYEVVFTPVTDETSNWINVMILRDSDEYYDGYEEDWEGRFDPFKVERDCIIYTNAMGSRRYLPEGIFSEVYGHYGQSTPTSESYVSGDMSLVCRAAYYKDDPSVTAVTAESLFVIRGGFHTSAMTLKGACKKTICRYQEGQVLSARPAYGGSSYINEEYAITWESLSGTVEGNGRASIRAVNVGMTEAQELKGVKAPDRAAPEPVPESGIQKTAVGSNEVMISFDQVEDNGTEYYFYAESYSTRTGELMCTSNMTKNMLTTGVKEYVYLIDTDPGTVLTGGENRMAAQERLSLTVEIQPFISYLHLAAADGAGNLSDTTHLELRMDDPELFWQPYTEQMDVGSVVGERDYENVYPAEEEKTYYVKADGSTPFLLEFQSYIKGMAREAYQINYQIVNACLTDGTGQAHTALLPYTVPVSLEETLDGSTFGRETEGAMVLQADMYMGARRSDRARRVIFYESFTLEKSLNGQVITVTPTAGAGEKNGEVLFSDSALDAANGLYLIADGEAPVITGLEAFQGVGLIDRTQGSIVLEVRAEDALAGVRDFYLQVDNLDNYGSRVYRADENGVIRVEVTKTEALFSGDFSVTGYAVDNVGNETRESWYVTEFSLEAEVTRILSPHEPVFKRGESGVLSVDAWGYVDRVEVEFPEFLASYNKTFDYTTFPDYKKEEEIQFMIPLYAPEGEEYEITVRAYKGDKKLEEHPSIRTLSVNGTVLDEIRTRLRG